jgi:hypothetical protein
MFGKHYEKTYEGSMVGAGSHVFAVWGYVIAKQKPDREAGSVVTLNPVLLSAIIGDTVERMEAAIGYLCAADPKTSTPGEDGRRLIRVGQFDYRVVNGAMYRQIRDEDDRREQTRRAQEKFRKKKSLPSSVPSGREQRYVEAIKDGDVAGADEIAAEGLTETVNSETNQTHEP